MDIGSLFLILALLIFVGLFIGRPLLERKAMSVSQEEHDLSSLLAERDRIINALQELDFDFSLGKIPEEDYPIQRNTMLQKGANILRQIDDKTNQSKDEDLEALIEAAIAARRADHNHRPASVLASSPADLEEVPQPVGQEFTRRAASHQDDEIEARIAARRRTRHDKSAGFCPQCGNPIQKSDRFCPRCGANLV